jgi:hypothetical protein
MQYLHPTDLTTNEVAAGFKLMRIENPNARIEGHPPTIMAVVYQVAPSYRLVKMKRPTDGKIHYTLRVFARVSDDPDAPPRWHYGRADYKDDDPTRAAGDIARSIRENPNQHFLLAVPEE